MFSKMIFRVGTVLPLLVGSTAMIGSGIILELVAPTTPAIAQTTFTTKLLLQLADQETYSVLVARAEANAEVKVQELFDKDLLRTEVRLTVLGQNGVAIAPVLKLRVSRQEWTSYPDPEIWSVYYPESQILLNLLERLEPEPEAETDTDTEEVIPILEETEPTEELPTPTPPRSTDEGTQLNDESTTEPVDSDTMIETNEVEMESAEDDTTENTDEEMNPSDDDTMMETDEEEMESSGNNTTRRRLRFTPAE